MSEQKPSWLVDGEPSRTNVAPDYTFTPKDAEPPTSSINKRHEPKKTQPMSNTERNIHENLVIRPARTEIARKRA